ncbi:MAG: hypothetical protein EBV37_00240, partial [Actinobacteria bacterium]|nr:hypothetical protein [Actinomycetota bacterium]
MIEFNFTSEQKRGLIFVFAAMIGLGGFYFLNSRPTLEQAAINIAEPIPQQSLATQLIINVAGKVLNPGVYQLPQGSRVIDALKAAGNQLKGVDISDI